MLGTCLVTGGAGFIGCALSSALADSFQRVTVMDNLHDQVHAVRNRPAALDERVEFIEADVTMSRDWDRVLDGCAPEVVVHLAAETGTGQSLTEATRHASVNVVGTARLLDAFTRLGQLPRRIVLTSSRAVYGEGAWRDANGSITYPGQRSREMLEAQQWDFPGLTPLPMDARTVVPTPTSIYGTTKLAQEHLVRSWCLAMGVEAVLYRLQNVYGAGQSLSNPYTGVVSYFAQRARAGNVLPVYEDGQIVRDFVHIDDVVAALLPGVVIGASNSAPFDIGSGQITTILELAQLIAKHYGAPRPVISGQYRHGDVRHASCTIAASSAALGWSPQVPLAEGLGRLCDWIDATVS